MLTYQETELSDPDGLTLGLGVADYSDILDMQVLQHGGPALGYSAAALYLPDFGISVAWLLDIGYSLHDLASSLMSRTWAELSDVIEASEPSSILEEER